MKKICFFIGSLDSGGGERVIVRLSKKLLDLGYCVEILTYYDKKDFYDIPTGINRKKVCKETKSTSIIKNISWIHKYFKGVDCVISFLAPFNMLAIVANTYNKTKLIVADRNDPKNIPSNTIIRTIRNILYRFADIVIVQTESNKAYFSKKVQRKSAVISNPIDLALFNSIVINHTATNNEIVAVGRLVPQKNHYLLIKAFSTFHISNPQYSLKIYGEGPERKKLQCFIDDLGLSDIVFLMGNEKHILEKIKDSALFVQTSKFEGMSNALIEAMCMGLICISTNVSGARELIHNGENGFLLKTTESQELSCLMEKVLSMDEEAKSTIRLKAQQLKNSLNIDRIIEQWIESIDNLLYV